MLAYFLLREEIHRNHLIALALELLAVLIIIDPLHASLDPTGALLAIASALVFSFYSVVGKKRTPRFGGIAVTCFSFLFGSVELLVLLLLGRTAAVGGLFASLGLDIFVNVPLFSGIPLSALPALAYICAVNSAAGYVCHMMALEKTRAGGVSHLLPQADLGADLRASFPQGRNSAQYDCRHRLLPDWIAVRDPAGDPCSTQGVESAKISFCIFSCGRAGGAGNVVQHLRRCLSPPCPKRREKAF